MTHSPHDTAVKAVLGQPEHARGLLANLLPPELADAIDWAQLALQPGSFVDLGQAARHADLLYSVAWRAGGTLQLYLLFEHQSSPPTDGPMAHRLLRYMGRIWDRFRADHPTATALPTILPIVLYHGAQPWSEPRAFDALLDAPPAARPALAPFLVRFEYLLFDLSALSDDALRARAQWSALVRLFSVCLKHARDGTDLLDLLARWSDVARDVARAPHGLEALALVIRYILEVSDLTDEARLQKFLDHEIGPQAKDTVMTFAQRYIEQGRLQGLEQSRQGAQAVLLQLLRQRFGQQVDAAVEKRVMEASLEQVQAWTTRVLSAASLTALFAG